MAKRTSKYISALTAAALMTVPMMAHANGDILGAVGISGDTSDKDEACAIAGVEAAGLKADPGGSKA